jgi:transposase
MELLTASHDELIALIHEQQAAIARLSATVASLEARIRDLEGGSGTATRMPGHKPARSAVPTPARPRRPRATNFARRRALPTQQVVHALAVCPTCQVALAGGSVKRTREVIEVPLTPVVVTDHVYVERCCSQCGRRSTPTAALDGVVIGRSRLGTGLVALIATLREEARLPYRAIQRLLASLYDLHLSVGGLRGVIGQVADAGRPLLETLQRELATSPVVQLDETGWREAGRNGYVWTGSTAQSCLFLHGGRDKGMLARLLGDDPQGVLVSDFYAVYDGYAGLQQKCWAHLLRDIHDLRVREAADLAVVGWAEAVGALYAGAQRQVTLLAGEPAESPSRQAARQRLMAELLALCRPYLQDADTPPGVLCRRIAKQLDNLFVFVLDPLVPATNNAAERSLRHLVVSRKISGGTRSRDGTADKLALASLFTTWRLRGLNPYVACRELLVSPQL